MKRQNSRAASPLAPFLPVLLLAACSTAGAPDEPPASPTQASPELGSRLLAAAEGLGELQLVGPYVLWAPELCMAPPPPGPSLSDADAESLHARKLYLLYASDAEAYLQATGVEHPWVEGGGTAPLGLTLVKDSYLPVEVPDDVEVDWWETVWKGPNGLGGYRPYARAGGELLGLGPPSGRFVMLRVERGTPGSHEGWVFGTVSPSGELTSAGAVAGCVDCHRDAEYDGLFGVAY
jgi:hypothetical protein